MATKTCLECGETKSTVDFPKNKRYRLGVLGHCWPCHRERHNAYIKRYRKTEGGNRRTVNAKLKLRYGITIEQYETMLEAQGGRCDICGAPPPEGLRLRVDHCHKTGKVRALLCGSCNIGMGQFADDPDRMELAVAYLRRWGGE